MCVLICLSKTLIMNVISAHLKVTHVKIQIEFAYMATNRDLYLMAKHLVPLFVRLMPQDVNNAILKCGLERYYFK